MKWIRYGFEYLGQKVYTRAHCSPCRTHIFQVTVLSGLGVESLLGLVVSPLSGREDFSLSVPGSVLSALCVLSHFIFSPL